MIPLLAALVLAGAAGAGPVFVSDVCGEDTTESEGGRCAVEEVEKAMRAKKRPKELKVEAEGKLYAVPAEVEMFCPASPATVEGWWQNFWRKVRNWAGNENAKAKATSSDVPDVPESPGSVKSSRCQSQRGCSDAKSEKEVRSVGEHSCQICFEHDHSTVMLPCGHGGLCWDCGLQIYALTEECPMCRGKIELIVQLDGNNRRTEGGEQLASVVC